MANYTRITVEVKRMNVRKLNRTDFIDQILDEKTIRHSKINLVVSKFGKVWFYLTLILTGLIVCFLIFVFWNQYETNRSQKNYQQELQIKELQNTLSSAVIEVNQGDFEKSRQTVGDFFRLLEKEVARGDNSIFHSGQREIIKGILSKKAGINQSLADKSPTASDELEKVLETYQKASKGFLPLDKKN